MNSGGSFTLDVDGPTVEAFFVGVFFTDDFAATFLFGAGLLTRLDLFLVCNEDFFLICTVSFFSLIFSLMKFKVSSDEML